MSLSPATPTEPPDLGSAQLTFSLWLKLLLATTVATVTPAIVMYFLLVPTLTAETRAGLELKARAVAGVVAGNLGTPLQFDDKQTATEILASAQDDEDLTYALVLKDGKEFTSHYPARAGNLRLELSEQGVTIEEHDQVLHLVVPILAGSARLGALQLGFSTRRVGEGQARAKALVLGICALMALIGVGLVQLGVARMVLRPVRIVTARARDIAGGHLGSNGEPVRSNDEMGVLWQAIDTTANNLRQSVSMMQMTAEGLTELARHITAETSDLNAAAQQQAATVHQTSTQVHSFRRDGEASRAGAARITDTTERSIAVAEEGRSAVSDAVGQVREIDQVVKIITSRIDDLRLQLGEVDEIVSGVNDISEQSNLLAVNAAVEAAKAGEHGRGFAVVAREVKRLSAQSKDSTARVRTTLGAIQHAIAELGKMATDGRKRTQAGVQGIEHTGKVIGKMADMNQTIAGEIQAIANTTRGQADGLDQIGLAMDDIRKAAEANLDGATRVQSSSQRLEQLATALDQLVGGYHLDDGDRAPSHRPGFLPPQ